MRAAKQCVFVAMTPLQCLVNETRVRWDSRVVCMTSGARVEVRVWAKEKDLQVPSLDFLCDSARQGICG